MNLIKDQLKERKRYIKFLEQGIKELELEVKKLEKLRSCKNCAKVLKCGHDEHCNYLYWELK